jgi:hypothetical protein
LLQLTLTASAHPNAGVNNHDVVVSLGRCIIPAKLLQILPGAAVKQKMDMTETAVHLPYKNKGMILGPGRDLLAINDSKSPFKPVSPPISSQIPN